MSDNIRQDSKPDQATSPLAARFAMEAKMCFHMSDSGFEEGTLAVYGKRIELIESSNDTTHEYSRIDGVVNDWDEKPLASAIQRGHIPCHRAHIVFNDLVRRGVLVPGDYFVRVCW